MNARRFGRWSILQIAFFLFIAWCSPLFWMAGAEPAIGSSPDEVERQFGLKPGPGRELVLAHCLPCHSTAIVAANHLPRERWAELVQRMQEKNGMRPIDEGTRKSILDYLETAQRPADGTLNAGKLTPWAAPLYRPNPLW